MANFDIVKAMFAQVDANKDGSIDRSEFRNWVGAGNSGNAAGGGLTSSTYESGAFQSSSTGGLDASNVLAASGSAGFVGQSATSGYEASFSSQSGVESADGLAARGSNNSYNAIGALSTSYDAGVTANASLESSVSAQQLNQNISTSGLFVDPNPQIIRRAATGGAVTYQQKILVRFLQPPPCPPPGPLIIKEIRPPQPPPPPPLVVRQRAPPIPQPPPLILRERPPQIPTSVASQTVIRRLAALPVPPRSVIIERLPPLPPKPRDIIIERWVPYGAQAKRRTIVQRATAAKEYAKPRNIIIQYEAPQVRVVRQFQRLGVSQENPQAYVSRYGTTLLDAAALLQQARAAGVVEDISPPAGSVLATQSNASASTSEAAFNYSSSSSAQQISSSGEATGLEGLQVTGGGGGGTGTYGLDIASSSISGGGGGAAGGGASGGATIGGGYSAESYSSAASYSAEGATASSGEYDATAASFAAADTNHDGSLDQNEFRRFVQGGL
ncbi:unnamed protein product [Adineta steineri]|uniref:EF-hand domain-containing protein n=1 Tax=Adineta steineri TaxID=433720 RepID=A0A813YVW0_9BILA|nr:unnamed protein product [Adineta steineri]CAF1472665.1 unnamed protein product [Adineta steineri]